MTFPFLTVPDPKTTSEGVLDPLGLSGVGDQLADEILPGLRARMVRPRFLTAMAVSAAVYEGLEDELARRLSAASQRSVSSFSMSWKALLFTLCWGLIRHVSIAARGADCSPHPRRGPRSAGG